MITLTLTVEEACLVQSALIRDSREAGNEAAKYNDDGLYDQAKLEKTLAARINCLLPEYAQTKS